MTPMLKQYLAIKQKVQDAILFFRLGDFYEMFFEDAEKASALLGITLTSRDGGSSGKVPMCGVPYHAARGYISRLNREGLKVAICEQVEDPQFAKGIVKREVVRIITPGTNLEDEDLFHAHNNYIAACYQQNGLWGLSYLDLSTGVFKLTEVNADEDVKNEISRLNPKEVIVPDALKEERSLMHFLKNEGSAVVNHYEGWVFDLEESKKQLERQFKLSSLQGLGLIDHTAGIQAAGALLYYLKDTLHNSLEHLKRPLPYHSSEYMLLDRRTQKNLELVESFSGDKKGITLFSVLDATVTPLGSRLLAQWIKQPLLSCRLITERHDAIEDLLSNPDCMATVRSQLKHIRDMERLLSRITCGVCSARELIAMKESLKIVPEIKNSIVPLTASLITKQHQELIDLRDLVSLLERSLVNEPPLSTKEGGFIKKEYHPALDELRDKAQNGKQWIAHFQTSERKATGIKSLKVSYNRVFGYYIEVTKANLSSVPESYLRKQTLVNAERFITSELKEMENSILGAEEKAHALEYELFEEIRKTVLNYIPDIQRMAEALAILDAVVSLATVAKKNRYHKPEIDETSTIVIKGGRHPVVERVLEEGQFIENDTWIDHETHQLLIITGPNMAGKSTYIRQVALMVIMAQLGSYVPAAYARIGLVDKIFTRIGANDNLAQGESTFMVEMIETAHILNNAGSKSLVILDEIGRGTSTFDGVSIAWAVCEFLNKSSGPRPKTLFATHFHELAELEHSLEGIKNYNITAREIGDEIAFMRKIAPGVADKSYGIQVGKLAGLPEEVVERSKEVLLYLEEEKISEEALAEKLSDKKGSPSLKPLPLFKHLEEKKDTGHNPNEQHPTGSSSPGPDSALRHPVVEEITQLKLDELTPLEALNKLHSLKEQIASSSPFPVKKNR
jgi:DNA mismatch repair protein MutS